MYSHPHSMTTVGSKSIRSRMILFAVRPRQIAQQSRTTYADTVVPERNIILLPLEADIDFLGSGDEFVEIANDSVGFSFGNTDDVCHKARVEKYRFPPCDWVRAD